MSIMCKLKNTILVLLLFALSLAHSQNNNFSQEMNLISVNTTENSFQLKNFDAFTSQDSIITKSIYPPLKRDYKRLALNTSLFLGTTVVIFGVLYALPEETSKWDKADMKEKGMFNKWKSNIKEGPVVDSDNFFFNYVTHPYSGAVYYMTARSSGFSILESFVYSALMSTFFWEYGVEAFAEVPSVQDLIITPVLGSVFGEGFFYIKKTIVKNDTKILNSRILGRSTLILIDPFNELLQGLGYKTKTNSQLNVVPLGVNAKSNQAIWGLNFTSSF